MPGPTVTAAEPPEGGAPEVILVVWGSFLAASNGSQVRVASLLDFLAGRFERVAVYSYAEHPAEPWTPAQRAAFARRYPAVALVLDRETRPLRWAKKIKEALVTLLPSAAPRILAARLPGQAAGWARLMAAGQPCVVVNYVDGLARLNSVPTARVLVETHDVKAVKRAKMGGTSPVGWTGLLRLRNEVGSLASAGGIVAISRAEATFFRALLGDAARIFCVPLYDAATTSAAVAPAASAERDIDMLFAASENPLNERGILGFLDRAADWHGAWRIALAGRICERPAVRGRAADLANVALLGFVDDLPALYRRTKLCLSPTDGTGLKIKVVEALRHGKPVLASDHSREGLAAGYEACVFPIRQQEAERLLGDPGALAAAEKAALEYHARLVGGGDRQAVAEWLATGTSAAPAHAAPMARP